MKKSALQLSAFPKWAPTGQFLISNLFFLLLFISCGTEETEIEHYGKDLQVIMKDDEGVFRGIRPGMKRDEIKSLEKIKLLEEDKDFLYYEGSIDVDSAKTFSISYTFEKDTLQEILVDIFPGSNKNALQLFTELKSLLDARYGASLFHNYEYIWDIDKQDKSKGKFSLADESSDYGYGKLTLYIYVDPAL